MTTDYYHALGLSKTATKEEIKKAYKKAALATHPDRAPADKKTQAEEAFRNVNAAYEILSNNETRALYDIHGVWPPPQDLPQRAKQPSRSQQPGRPQPGFYEVPQPASSYHHFVFTDPRALFEAIFEEFKHVHAQQIHAQHIAQKHVQAAAATYSDAFVPYAPPPAGIFPPQYPSASSFPAFQAQPPPQPFTSSSSRTEQVSTNGLWIKESKVIKLTSTGTREVTLKRTDVDGTVYITRQAGDGSRRYFISKDGVEQPTTEKTPEVPPSSKSQSQSTRQSSSATRYTHTATASQPANFASFAAPAPQPQSSASAAPRRSPPTYRVASPGPASAPLEQRASRSAERADRPPHSSASATYPVQPVPRRALSPVGAELRRNHSMPSNVVPSTPMPRPQSPAFYQRSRTSSSTDALRMKSSTKVSTGYKPTLGAYESQPSSAATSRASSVEPMANNSNEFGYIPSSRSKSSKSQSQPPVQSSTTVALNNTVKQRSSEHVATVSQSQFKAPIPQVQPPMQQQMQQQVQQQTQPKAQPKVQQPVPQVYQSSAPTRSSSQQPAQQAQPQAYQPSTLTRSSSQQPASRSSHVSSQPAPSARYPPGRESGKIKVTNGLGLGDVPPPPVTGSISGQSRAQEYLSRHSHQQQQAGLYAPQVPIQRNGSYEFTAQPPPMMYTGAGPVPVPGQMRMDPTQQWVAHQDYHRRMQHA